MIKLTFNMQVRRRLANPAPSADEMRAIAEAKQRAEAERIRSGINAAGQAAKPLSEGYRRIKSREAAPIRNWNRTGAMMASRGVAQVSESLAVIDFVDPAQKRKAGFLQAQEPMVGNAPSDNVAIEQAVREVYSRKPLKVKA